VSFKKRAPRAIKEIRDFAVKAMVRLPPPTFMLLLGVFAMESAYPCVTSLTFECLDYRSAQSSKLTTVLG
jgi:hypothetical protein